MSTRDPVSENLARRAFEDSVTDPRHQCTFFWKQECASTMDESRTLIHDGQALPFAIFAECQTDGRGRNGNSWQHGVGGLAGTFVLQQFSSHQECSGLSLVIGVSIAEFFEYMGIALQLKWPNDVLLPSGEKVGGVLIELQENDTGVIPLVGIGLNLGEQPTGIRNSQTLSLTHEREFIAGALAARFLRDVTVFTETRFESFRDRFHMRAAYKGESVTFQCGGQTVRGVYEGVDPSGALIVNDNGSRREYHSADCLRRS